MKTEIDEKATKDLNASITKMGIHSLEDLKNYKMKPKKLKKYPYDTTEEDFLRGSYGCLIEFRDLVKKVRDKELHSKLARAFIALNELQKHMMENYKDPYET